MADPQVRTISLRRVVECVVARPVTGRFSAIASRRRRAKSATHDAKDSASLCGMPRCSKKIAA
jgi:hypothetical protein